MGLIKLFVVIQEKEKPVLKLNNIWYFHLQIQRTCDEATKEKDSMVVKYAQAEHKNLEYLKHAERLDVRLKEVEKEKEGFVGKFKAVKEHRTKVAAELEAKVPSLSSHHLLCVNIIAHPTRGSCRKNGSLRPAVYRKNVKIWRPKTIMYFFF